jgi:hypothetical protein
MLWVGIPHGEQCLLRPSLCLILQRLRHRSVTTILLGTCDAGALQSASNAVVVHRSSDDVLMSSRHVRLPHAKIQGIDALPQIRKFADHRIAPAMQAQQDVSQGCDNGSRLSSCDTIDDIVATCTRKVFSQLIRLDSHDEHVRP